MNVETTPAWRRKTEGEQRWPAGLALLVMVGLQWFLPERLSMGPRWLFPGIELVIVAVITMANPGRVHKSSQGLRLLGLILIAVGSLGNAYSVGRLLVDITSGYDVGSATKLLASGATVYLINVLTFSVWFWELDRGGPVDRANGLDPYPDFLFAPMTSPDMVEKNWEPQFVDYFYLAFTNATAFSPTDTLPLTRWAKLTMAAESAISLVTASLVIARAINILQ